jgi:hypothetical protein
MENYKGLVLGFLDSDSKCNTLNKHPEASFVTQRSVWGTNHFIQTIEEYTAPENFEFTIAHLAPCSSYYLNN